MAMKSGAEAMAENNMTLGLRWSFLKLSTASSQLKIPKGLNKRELQINPLENRNIKLKIPLAVAVLVVLPRSESVGVSTDISPFLQ